MQTRKYSNGSNLRLINWGRSPRDS